MHDAFRYAPAIEMGDFLAEDKTLQQCQAAFAAT